MDKTAAVLIAFFTGAVTGMLLLTLLLSMKEHEITKPIVICADNASVMHFKETLAEPWVCITQTQNLSQPMSPQNSYGASRCFIDDIEAAKLFCAGGFSYDQ